MADKITHAQNISSKIKGNPFFPTPNPPLTTVDADIAVLVQAETEAKGRTASAVPKRDTALAVVIRDLHGLTLYVQSIADVNSDKAKEIIEGAGLFVKSVSPRSKSDLTVKSGSNSGTVILVARGAGSRSAHNWQMSKDQTVWTDLPTTIAAKTEIVGLTYGSTMYFRHRAVIKTGTEAWTNPVSFLVK